MNRKNVYTIGGVLAVVLLAVVIAFGTAGGGEEESVEGAFGEVTVTGSVLPPLAEGAADPAVGLEAPAITGVDHRGNPVEIVPGGEPGVIIFLAHWCPHCQAEVPRLQQWIEETGGPEGVSLSSVATSTDRFQANFPPGKWLDSEGWTVPVVLDDVARTAGNAYGVNAFPFWVVVDADGRVVSRFSGELDRNGIEQLFGELAAS